MATTTEFGEWLDMVSPEGHEEVYALYYCVRNEEANPPYECKRNKEGRLFVTCEGKEDTLMISTEKAQDYFLVFVEKRYCGEMDIDSWYGYQIALNNEKS